MANQRLKVLYILGMGRSGTTIINRVLGEIDGFFSVGALHNIWNRSVIQNRICGCGAVFRDCELWNQVFTTAYGGMDEVDAKGMLRLHRAHVGNTHLPALFVPGQRRRLGKRLRYYLGVQEKLYAAIGQVTKGKIIVDSSLHPTYLNILSMIPSLDLRVVHLIRDPRAVAYSCQKIKPDVDGGSDTELMRRISPWFQTIRWDVQNWAAERVLHWHGLPSIRLIYEDFCRSPREAVEAMVNLAGCSAESLPFVSDHSVKLGTLHTVAGNPNRFQTGEVEIRSDDAWKTLLKTRHRLTVTALSWPWLRRYGFDG